MGATSSEHERQPDKIEQTRTPNVSSARFWLGLPPGNFTDAVVYLVLAPLALLRLSLGVIAPLLQRAIKMVLLLLTVWIACFSLLSAPAYFSAIINFTQSELYRDYMLALMEFTNGLLAGKITQKWAEGQPSVQYIADLVAPCMLLAWTAYLLREMWPGADRSGLSDVQARVQRAARSSLEYSDVGRAARRLWSARALAIAYVVAKAICLAAAVSIWWVLLFFSFRDALGWWPQSWNWIDVALHYFRETVNTGLFSSLDLFGWRFGPVASLGFYPRLIEYLLVLGCVVAIASALFRGLRIDLAPYAEELSNRLAEKEPEAAASTAAPLGAAEAPAS